MVGKRGGEDGTQHADCNSGIKTKLTWKRDRIKAATKHSDPFTKSLALDVEPSVIGLKGLTVMTNSCADWKHTNDATVQTTVKPINLTDVDVSMLSCYSLQDCV